MSLSISPVSGATPVTSAPAPKAPPAAQAPASSPQDTVHLSQAALSASGDVDHDGDSH